MLVASMALVAAACGGATQTTIDLGGPVTAAPDTQPPMTESTDTSETPSTEPSSTQSSATTQPATTTRQRPEGPDASNFELALGGPGGTFSLSGETRPVFMVFWAEW